MSSFWWGNNLLFDTVNILFSLLLAKTTKRLSALETLTQLYFARACEPRHHCANNCVFIHGTILEEFWTLVVDDYVMNPSPLDPQDPELPNLLPL